MKSKRGGMMQLTEFMVTEEKYHKLVSAKLGYRFQTSSKKKYLPNKALHLTAIPLRSIAAGELGRWAARGQAQ